MSARPRKPADSKRSYTRLLRPDERSGSAEPGDAPARLARDSAAEFQAQARIDPATDLGDLPSAPGVYRMIGADGAVLYVGKARDLKKRVSTYFQKSGHGPRIARMIEQIVGVEISVTRSENEALLLENNLIKGLSPKYNILFRDDKSYPYIVMSQHAYPRLGRFRGTPDKRQRFFGPFASAGAVRQSLQLLQRVFRLRTCTDNVMAHRSRPCLLYQIKRCSGPCVGLVSSDDYAADVQAAALFLEGKADEVTASIEARMSSAAEALEYEQAALFRDQLSALAKVRAQQAMTREGSGLDDIDVLAVVQQGGMSAVGLALVRNGQHMGDRVYVPQHGQDADAIEVLLAFMEQRYAEGGVPPELVLNVSPEPGELDWLQAVAGRAVKVGAHPRADRRVWLKMAEEAALRELLLRLGDRANQNRRLAELADFLQLEAPPRRIECFDISHTMGEATVASCVVYEDGAMRPDQYRRYNITTVNPGDDYGAIREALGRRLKKAAGGEGTLPDVLLIDGGRGQLNVACEVLNEHGLSDLLVLGVAKGVERKAGMEQLVFPDEDEPRRLPPDHPALHLIQQVRDEAHRFAITGHRARRGKARRSSSLEDIEGVGPARRRQLLAHFGGLRGVQSASIDDIARVEGISRTLAERIYRELH
ncbi:MAG: excinuclease ABC subunit UvrC [Betaproteobacteria bacterium]|nr:excinuclease ABC subunit UvrC [Betaproteobacteria bacterium]